MVDSSCNIIFGSGIDENMEEEVEITVITTGFSGATLTDDMKEEVKRTVVAEVDRAEKFVHGEINNKSMFNIDDVEEEEVVEQKQTQTSRIEVDDSKIPPFLRKMKNKRF